MPHPVDVAELKRAAVALHAGAFAMTSHTRLGMVGGDDLPAGLSLVVAGVAGGVGASTVALAIAEAGGMDRLWDVAPAVTSGLVGVCDRELGVTDALWREGRRGRLLVQRSPLDWSCTPGECPLPPQGDHAVLDAGWDVLSLRGARGWIAKVMFDSATPVVLVSRCTVPGLRRLEVALELVDPTGGRDVRVAITGLPSKRWPREITQPAPVARLEKAGRVAYIPETKVLAMRGLDSQSLPAAVLAAVSNLH